MSPRVRFLFPLLLILSFLSACTSTSLSTQQVNSIKQTYSQLIQKQPFNSETISFGKDITIENETELFTLPNHVKQELDQIIASKQNQIERFKTLRNWSFNYIDGFDYDPNTTVSISELENTKKINCLSFSMLYLAAARYVGIPADVQIIYSPNNWDSVNNTWIQVQHINVIGTVTGFVDSSTLSISEKSKLGLSFSASSNHKMVPIDYHYVVDINTDVIEGQYETVKLRDNEVISRYYNNIAAAKIVNNQYQEAYEYNKKSLQQDMFSAEAWNNFGVLFSKIGKPAEARVAYLTALEINPEASFLRNNLYATYIRTGETENREKLIQLIDENRQRNPYYHYQVGKNNLDAGNFDLAEKDFKKAIELKSDESLFYVALSQAQVGLSQQSLALKSIEKAKNIDKDELLETDLDVSPEQRRELLTSS